MPDGRKPGRRGNLKPGIYRAKTGDVQLLFTYARRQPTVPVIFDFEGVVRERSQAILPSLLSKALDDALK